MKRVLLFLSIFYGLSVQGQQLIAKLKPAYKQVAVGDTLLNKRLGSLMKTLGVTKTHAPVRSVIKSRFLDGMIEIHLKDGAKVQAIADLLQQSGYFQYVEAVQTSASAKPLHTPSDPFADPQTGVQDYLARIHAYQAWEVSKGDSNSFICFLDNGIDWNHPEFKNKIKYNTEDTLDGIDNDQDGYIDNYMGWDFVSNDPFPEDSTGANMGHGTEVAGPAVAETNNGLGIASVGYNTKIVPIKIFGPKNISDYVRYVAIVYAADRGCKVINLSWGSPSNGQQYQQDMINYAALEKDAVIVAATYPIEGDNVFTYPADYENVVSAVGLHIDDTKAYPQSYHYWMDLSVPSINIQTTALNGEYSYPSGISVGIPMVSAAASLIRGKYPWMNSQQVSELLRVSGDDIDTVKTNIQLQEKLGHGKLNVFRALTDTTTPAVRILQYELRQVKKDTFSLELGFKNYLWSSKNLTLTLRQLEGGIKLNDSIAYIGKLKTLDSANTALGDLKFRILPFTGNPYELIRIGIQDTSLHYNDFFYFYLDKSAYVPIITEVKETAPTAPCFRLFPNPSKDQVFIEGEDIVVVVVQDAVGHVLFSKKGDANMLSFDMRDKAKGVYLATVHTSLSSYTLKFIKD